MGAVADVQAYLVAQGLVDGGTGWTSYRRFMPDRENQVVVISEDGGPDPEARRATGMGSAALGDAGVQVMVRGGPRDSDASEAKASAILNALHGLGPTTMDATEYKRTLSLTLEPIFAGFDDNERPIHTCSFRLTRVVAEPVIT